MNACACGCGASVKYRFVRGHAPAQRTHYASGVHRGWNRGQSYVIDKGRPYANKHGWRQAMRRWFGNRCMNCGWDAAPVDAHHVVMRSNSGENTIANGVLLCPNCHRLAHIGKLTSADLERLHAEATPLVVKR